MVNAEKQKYNNFHLQLIINHLLNKISLCYLRKNPEKRMRKTVLTLFILMSFILPTVALSNDNEKKSSVNITEAERKMAEEITVKQLKEYLYFIASDEMGGRDTPSRGLDITAKFMAMMLSRWNFKPGGDDGTFFQKMTAQQRAIKSTLKIGERSFIFGDDFVRFRGNGSFEAPLVFGKDGWMVKSKGIDAFEGIDVKDKIVVLYGSKNSQGTIIARPEGVTQADLNGKKGVDWADPLTYVQEKGAKGAIIVVSPDLEKSWTAIKANFGRSGRVSIEGLGNSRRANSNPTTPQSMPIVLARGNVGEFLFANESGNKDSAKAFSLKKSGKITSESIIKKTPTQNVVAIWEGSDPKLKNEYVAIGAHYDHVGTRPNAPGKDKIWNGADDDGSGTVAVLAIAEALAKAKVRPKRSILLVWHAAEEKGLLGAAYFNKYPTVNIKNVVTQLNIDMIGRSKTPDMKVVKCAGFGPCNENLTGPNEVYIIGSEMMSSKLGEVTKATNSSYLNLTYNLKYDDPNDKEQFFFRSDHYHYAKNGIPVVFWFSGTHLDYHGPADHADKIDYQKLEKIARTIFLTMWEIAELKERPAVDKELHPRLRGGRN